MTETKGDLSILVAVSDMVVAEDIAGTVSELHPGAEILSARSLEEAEELMAACGVRIGIAILEARPRELDASLAGNLLAANGTRVLFLCDAPGDGASGTVAYLPMPFTTDALLAALREVAPRQTADL